MPEQLSELENCLESLNNFLHDGLNRKEEFNFHQVYIE